MPTNPFISIITPSFNQGQFITETISTVLAQDYPYFEQWVIDGGSSDSTLSTLEKHSASQHFHWISEPDRGQVDAIQKGFAYAQGDILTWLNSDDTYLHPAVLDEVAQLFAQNPNIQVISGRGQIITANGAVIKTTTNLNQRTDPQQLRWRNFILQPATFFRRSVIEKFPLDSRLHFAFDWDFWIRLASSVGIHPVDAVWAGYRWWGENKTANPAQAARRAVELAEVSRRYLGSRAWQTKILSAFASAYSATERLPRPVQPRIQTAVHFCSQAISSLTQKRIAVA